MNPFRAETLVRIALDGTHDVAVDVLDPQGRRVRRIAEGLLGPGSHIVRWDGRTGSGLDAAPGVYLITLHAGDEMTSAKVIRQR